MTRELKAQIKQYVYTQPAGTSFYDLVIGVVNHFDLPYPAYPAARVAVLRALPQDRSINMSSLETGGMAMDEDDKQHEPDPNYVQPTAVSSHDLIKELEDRVEALEQWRKEIITELGLVK